MIEIGFWEFLVILMLIFALAVLIAGLFTAYFGAGKSRKIGVVLILVGLIVGIMFTLVPIREATGIPPASSACIIMDVPERQKPLTTYVVFIPAP